MRERECVKRTETEYEIERVSVCVSRKQREFMRVKRMQTEYERGCVYVCV